MDKKVIIAQLVKQANEYDANGMHHEADVLHERIRVANQSDFFGAVGQGLGNAWSHLTNPIGNAINDFDPVNSYFIGAHDNTGRIQDGLRALQLAIANSYNIDNATKATLNMMLTNTLQSSQLMNPEYFKQHNPDLAQAPVQQAPAPVMSREDAIKGLQQHASALSKYRRVEAQTAPTSDLPAILEQATHLQQIMNQGVATNVPGSVQTKDGIDHLVATLNNIAQKQPGAAPTNTSAPTLEQMQAAYNDPAVQAMLQQYMLFGLQNSPQAMFAEIDKKLSTGADYRAFKSLLTEAWKKYQPVWDADQAKKKQMQQQQANSYMQQTGTTPGVTPTQNPAPASTPAQNNQGYVPPMQGFPAQAGPANRLP